MTDIVKKLSGTTVGISLNIEAIAEIESLRQQLQACQAREAKLREYIFMISTSPAYPEAIYKWSKEALEMLLEAADDAYMKEQNE